jgi:hypothetical protein
MLVATRDPMPHPGPHDPSTPHRDPRDGMRLGPGGPPPRSARFVTLLQLAGSFMAIPVGLASAYSIYKANFSPDTQCMTLRTSIIAMIDKKIDAPTRRMLVRRDVEAFEKSCGNFDPDAKAAFVTLLAAEPRTVPVHAAPVAAVAKPEPPKVEAAKAESPKTVPAKTEPVKPESVKAETPRPETPAKEAVRKAEPRAAPVKQAAAPAAPEADATASDARWLDAVRGALVNHSTGAEATAAVNAPVAARVAAPEIRGSIKTNTPAPQSAALAPVPQAPVQDAAAPALPPATSIGAPPAPPRPQAREADADHPVPPGSIPDGAQPDDRTAEDADQQGDSRFGWVSKIPVIGPALK